MTLTEKKKALQMYKKEVTQNQVMRDLLIEIIQTLDSEYSREVQSTKNSIGLIRSNIDQILNK
tara:strand:+ start:342 stop:530 length:189 start_codon:yes stop_codon:yes gene_type:complete